jgi:uncharacterized membrane protein (DUF485 family)
MKSTSIQLVVSILLTGFASYATAQSLGSDQDPFAALFVLLVLLAAYFLPWIVAKFRGHRSSLAIFWTVLLLGWSGFAWLLAFIWACTSNTERNHEARVVVIRESSKGHR